MYNIKNILAFMWENEIWICTSNVFSDRIAKQYPISEYAIITCKVTYKVTWEINTMVIDESVCMKFVI